MGPAWRVLSGFTSTAPFFTLQHLEQLEVLAQVRPLLHRAERLHGDPGPQGPKIRKGSSQVDRDGAISVLGSCPSQIAVAPKCSFLPLIRRPRCAAGSAPRRANPSASWHSRANLATNG